MLDKGSNLRIGEILLKKGIITEEQIQKALKIQKEERELAELALGQIMVKKGLLTDSQVEQLSAHPDLRRRLGDMAVLKGLVERKELEKAFSESSSSIPIGKLMVSKGLITEEQRQELLREQINSPDIAALAVKLGFINEREMKKYLRIKQSPRLLGEILCEQNFISPFELNNVLKQYGKSIGIDKIILNDGLVSKEELDSSLKMVNGDPLSLGNILISKKLLSKDQFLESLAKHLGIKYLTLEGFEYDEKSKDILSGLINSKYAEKNQIIPISINKNEITIALTKPSSIGIIQEIKKIFSHLEVSCVLVSEDKFGELFKSLYNLKPAGIVETTDDDLRKAGEIFQIDSGEDSEEGRISPYHVDRKDVETEELVNFIVKYAILNRASDIHIERDREGPRVRYRIDGVMQEPNLPWLKAKLKEKIAAIISRIKVISDLDIAEKRLPQDGVFRVNYYNRSTKQKFDIDFRVATCRAIVGENVIIRILDSRKADNSLYTVGFSPDTLERLEPLLKSSSGMILATGPTGSGKTSTLYALLKYLYKPEVTIITAEDPIEYSFPGIMQTQAYPKIGLTFSRLLRSFLRLDPDIILVGEMRDEETAKIGFDAAQTGHFFLSTLHTNDAIQAIRRLLDLKIDYGQISASLKGILAQRLVRKICPHCIEEYKPDEIEWGVLFDREPKHLKFYRGEGCETCFFSGYKGRTVISELFVIDKEISYRLSRGVEEEYLRKMALESGMKTMLEDGLSKLHETTMSEVLRVIPHDMLKMSRKRVQAQDLVDDLIDSMLKKKKEPLESVPNVLDFSLSDLGKEAHLVDKMEEEYRRMRTLIDPDYDTVDSSYFKEFIIHHFQRICNEHKCQRVNFFVSNGTGMTEVRAAPEFIG
ncbi:MAG: Flp pilus assembly complex ATPase component TadA [Desulfobacterales bacterium]|nr:Flp pilus assembly complex ATPase component TadA [Desulfobacterales bacterium]